MGKVAETGEKITTRRKGPKPLTSRQAQSEAGKAFERPKIAEFAQKNPGYVVSSNARFPWWMRVLWPVKGHGPDAIGINSKTKTIKVFDSAGSPTTRHLIKTRNYVAKIRAGLPDALKDYKVVWEERYWQFGQKTRKGPGQKGRKGK